MSTNFLKILIFYKSSDFDVGNVDEVDFVDNVDAEASRIGISEISGDTKLLRFTFFPDARIRTEGLPDLITEMRGALRYVPKDPPALLYRGRDEASGQRKPVTKVLKELLDRFTKCFREADSENVKQGPEKS